MGWVGRCGGLGLSWTKRTGAQFCLSRKKVLSPKLILRLSKG
jgi:hypothetical protein